MEALLYLANEQTETVGERLKTVLSLVEGAMPQLAATLIQTEYEVSQARANAWRIYKSAELNEKRIEATVMINAAREGHLEGKNTDERKLRADTVKITSPDIIAAQDNTLMMRNMSDCLNNAHASLGHALKLVMELVVQNEDPS